MKNKKSDIRIIKITLPQEQAEIVHSQLIGKFGNCAAEVVSTMVYDWLKDNGWLRISKNAKKRK